MLHKSYWFLTLNVVLYVLVFVYYGFYERTFFYYMHILKIGKTMKKKKKAKKKQKKQTTNKLGIGFEKQIVVIQ